MYDNFSHIIPELKRFKELELYDEKWYSSLKLDTFKNKMDFKSDEYLDKFSVVDDN